MDRGERPLGAYGLLLALYAALVAGFFVQRARSGEGLPERVALGDLCLIGVATHKASRLITRDRVTAPIRAPFTEREAGADSGEAGERPRGDGLRRAVGELVACPYCVAQWVATAFVAAYAVAPRSTRFLATVLTTVEVSDFLQIAYRAAQQRAQPQGQDEG